MVTTSFVTSENRDKRAAAYWFVCEKTEDCPLHKEGKCACFRYILGKDLMCPNAEKRFAIGPTKRAKSHSEWVSRMKDTVAPTASEFNKKIAEVAGYVFCPINYLDAMAGQKVNGVVNEHFFPTEEFNADKIEEIVQHRPRSFFENMVLKAYLNEELPKFILQLKETFPKLYEEWAAKYPESAEKFKNASSVGRTAYVATLPDGCKVNGFVKNGDYLEADSYKDVIFRGRFGSNKPLNIRVRIEDDMTVKVTELMVTDKNVRFVD